MTLIAVGPTPPGDPFPPQWAVAGSSRDSARPISHRPFTAEYDAELAVSVSRKENATIGLVGPSFIP